MRIVYKVQGLTLFLLLIAGISSVSAQDYDSLFDMSLEDLMNLEVTSVSKKAERLQDVASSIYVLSSADIEKSGATNLHEALRLVPGYWGVQDEYSSVYATVRNSPAENVFPGTVLYLLDGTPIQELMSSTFSFQNFDIPLEEIDRIEVIKGSGGTIYGANSATGVVNIFTKNPEKYDGINVRAEGASPGYVNATVRAGGKISDKVSLSGYAKFRSFSGYGSLAGKDENGNATGVNTNFTKDFDQQSNISFGAKLNAALSEKSTLSARLHYNTLKKDTYTSAYGRDFVFTRDDVLYENEVNANRLVANVRFDRMVNENHHFFIRASTNMENDLYRLAGGMQTSNAIYDFEFQDNFSLGQFNDFSAGINYRSVVIDVHDINDPEYINYVNPQSNEALTGAFIQDKIKLMGGKLNLLVGIKAENYSLVNEEYYFSPMAKVSFIANDNLTLWGGFTQSYTTPGFNNTNVDLFVFQTPTQEEWTAVLTPQITPIVTQVVYDGAYQQAYDAAIGGGSTPGDADTFASATATAYINSAAGMATIQAGVDGEIQNVVDNTPNIAAKNGSKTVPSKFQTWEIGFKANLIEKVQLQSTFFLTNITDGIAVNPGNAILTNIESETQPGRFADYYLYGNYVKGESKGMETLLRLSPISGLILEASHTWLTTTWEFQENDDFDLGNVNENPTPDPGFAPEHVVRFKLDYEFAKTFNLTANFLATSKFKTQNYYYYNEERYENLVESDVFGNNDGGTLIVEDHSRTILSIRLEKTFLEEKLGVYLFGNDITNSGDIATTDKLKNVTLSKMGAMYGLGVNFKIK